MRTRAEATETLIEAGWTAIEVDSVLGTVAEKYNISDLSPSGTPWWTWVGEDWYTGGTPIVAGWENWLETHKS
jgi:hypothetical protein